MKTTDLVLLDDKSNFFAKNAQPRTILGNLTLFSYIITSTSHDTDETEIPNTFHDRTPRFFEISHFAKKVFVRNRENASSTNNGSNVTMRKNSDEWLDEIWDRTYVSSLLDHTIHYNTLLMFTFGNFRYMKQ